MQTVIVLFNLKAGVKAGIGTCEPLPDPDRSRAMSLYALETALLDKEHSAVRVEDAVATDLAARTSSPRSTSEVGDAIVALLAPKE